MDIKKVIYTGKWLVLLAIFWLLLSGFFKPLLLTFGLASLVLTYWVLHRMDRVDGEERSFGFGLKMISYVFWLLGQVIISSLEVTKLVWGPKRKVSPAISKLPVKEIPKGSQVKYANSITLTPGTLCVDIDDDHVTVHALRKDSIVKLEAGSMAKRVKKAAEGEI